MTGRKKTPTWVSTNVPLEDKIRLWKRMALGDTDTQVQVWLQQQKDAAGGTMHLDRKTIARLRRELALLPRKLAKKLPAHVQEYWENLQAASSPVVATRNKTPPTFGARTLPGGLVGKPTATPRVRLGPLRVDVFTDGIWYARYATVEVTNDSEVAASNCYARAEAEVSARKLDVPLNWSDIEPTPAETTAPRITIDPGQLAVEHAHKLRAVAKQLVGELSLPPPEYLGSWVPPWKRILEVWPPGVSDRWLRSVRWTPEADGPGTYRLGMEDAERGLTFSRLRAYLPEPLVPWTALDRWKAGVATLLWDCRQLTTEIVQACEEATGAEIHPDQEKFDQGLWWGFPAQVYYGHLRAAQQYDDPLDYTPEYTSTGWTLRKAGYRVAGHTCLGAILEWRDVHTKLLECPKWKERARELVERYRVLEQQAESVQQALRREVERGMFDGGRCDDRCPYSKRGAAGWPGGQ